ncbi:Uncharacterized protein DAT39_005401 [Clarias magur]|uniref:Uncharacterized protein n=1 Tax=Clarias magur TaxID=1594786 RepID=A0A8J4UEA7_CLAMG|nr:Uncharacterized protein DAT39_005401 [Clarias magur]
MPLLHNLFVSEQKCVCTVLAHWSGLARVLHSEKPGVSALLRAPADTAEGSSTGLGTELINLYQKSRAKKEPWRKRQIAMFTFSTHTSLIDTV